MIPESPYTQRVASGELLWPCGLPGYPQKHWELITVEDIEKAADKVEGGIQEGDWVLICTA